MLMLLLLLVSILCCFCRYYYSSCSVVLMLTMDDEEEECCSKHKRVGVFCLQSRSLLGKKEAVASQTTPPPRAKTLHVWHSRNITRDIFV